MDYNLSAAPQYDTPRSNQASSDTDDEAYEVYEAGAADSYFEAQDTDEGADLYSNDEDSTCLEGMSRMVTEMAPELHNMVLRWLWQTAFYPGFVYPQIHIEYDSYVCQEFSPVGARPDLLLLDENIMGDHEKHFWSENTVVIGPGCPSYSTDFLDKIPASNCIRKIDLTFSIVRDLAFDLAVCLPTAHPSWQPYYSSGSEAYYDHDLSYNGYDRRKSAGDEYEDYPDEENIPYCSQKRRIADTESLESGNSDDAPVDESTSGDMSNQQNDLYNDPNLANPQASEHHDELLTFELKTIWLDKIYEIRYLQLTELTLDFFECYSTDGRWMGSEIAAEFPAFYHGMPEVLRIFAPDPEKRDELEMLIRARTP